jgi:hypothetical protein
MQSVMSSLLVICIVMLLVLGLTLKDDNNTDYKDCYSNEHVGANNNDEMYSEDE